MIFDMFPCVPQDGLIVQVRMRPLSHDVRHVSPQGLRKSNIVTRAELSFVCFLVGELCIVLMARYLLS